MGSLGIRPIYHHLYDFGNLPVFGAFGCKRRANEVLENGTVVQCKYINIKFVLDERIVDGYYYATFFKYYRSLLRHPELLDSPPFGSNFRYSLIYEKRHSEEFTRILPLAGFSYLV